MKLTKLRIIGLAFVALISVVLIIADSDQPTSSNPPTQNESKSKANRRVDVGERGRLSTGVEGQLGVAVDKKTLDESTEATDAKDDYGYAQLFLTGRMFMVEEGTPCLVLENQLNGAKILIMEGPQANRAGWVPYEWVLREEGISKAKKANT